MKTLLPLLTVALVSLTAHADPLNRKLVAADSRWVLHLDADALRQTTLGSRFLSQVLEPKSASGKADLKRELDFDLDWARIQSITVYGATFQPKGSPDPTGVLLIRTDLGVQAALDRAMARNAPGFRVQKIEAAGGPFYTLNDDACVAFAPGNLVLVGKSQDLVHNARRVVTGASPSLAGAPAFSGYPAAASGSFLVAMAEGFAEQPALPPDAAVLKNARGAQISAREQGDRLQLQLNILTASSDVARQVQQIAQGLIALVSLGGNQNPELQTLAQSCALTTADACVNLTATLPTSDLMRKLSEAK